MSDDKIVNAVWDLLAELGYVDARGGAEYRRVLEANPLNRAAFEAAAIAFLECLS